MKSVRACLLAIVASLLAATYAKDAFATTAACDGGILDLRSGSEADVGWTGIDHNREVSRGSGFAFAIVRRCSDSNAVCQRNADCESNLCKGSCDCVGDSTCEIAGPIGTGHCLTDLTDCSSNSDCSGGAQCAKTSAPPLPSDPFGVPTCTVNYFDSSLSGTADVSTGQVDLSATLKSRVFLGISLESPCPRCGAPNETPEVGDSFTCEGGPNDGESCHVDAVSETFGGTSYDCPPSPAANVSGAGLTTRLNELTTGTTTRTAELPCKFFGFTGNPTVPDSNPKCLDNGTACTSNADCKRCTEDPTTACTNNGNCAGKGVCAEAPDQPVTCGFWCHCGFCNGNPSKPCFTDGECSDGESCVVGTGTGTQPNAPQQRPNDCHDDQFICGMEGEELCATDIGRCSEQHFHACENNADCENEGVCESIPHPCFESQISRSGAPSSLGTYCANSGQLCTDNGDCPGGEADACLSNVLVPRLEALYCQGGSANSAVNSITGLTGPAALTWQARIEMCRCNVPVPECDDVCADLPICDSRPDDSPCSDGNPCTIGDKCAAGQCVSGNADAGCTTTTTSTTTTVSSTTTLPEQPLCGDWNGDENISSSDALGVLQAAVGIHFCELAVCDFNGDASITANDALAVLRASVELPSSPSCPSVTTTT